MNISITMDCDYIMISDEEDDIEIIDCFTNLEREPIIIDLTKESTPQSKQRPFHDFDFTNRSEQREPDQDSEPEFEPEQEQENEHEHEHEHENGQKTPPQSQLYHGTQPQPQTPAQTQPQSHPHTQSQQQQSQQQQQRQQQSPPPQQPQPPPQPRTQPQYQSQFQPESKQQPDPDPEPQREPEPQQAREQKQYQEPQKPPQPPQQQSQPQPHHQPQSQPQPVSEPQPHPHPQIQPQLEQTNHTVQPAQPGPPNGRAEEPTHPAKPDKPSMSDHELMNIQKSLGNEKYKHNLFDDAVRIYKRANQLAKQLGDNEMSATLHFNLAMTYYKLGSYDQATDECANAVRLKKDYMKAHLKRAEIYSRQCKFEEAVICYEHICDLDSSNRDYAILLKQARDRAKLTKKKGYNQILGLGQNFTKEELRKAYRQKALNHHPDRHSDADFVTRKIEEKRFKEASEAHSYIQLKYGYTR